MRATVDEQPEIQASTIGKTPSAIAGLDGLVALAGIRLRAMQEHPVAGTTNSAVPAEVPAV